MAGNSSFDVSTGADLQEVDNAVNQAVKEIAQRYDFKGTHVTIEFDRTKAVIRLAADDEFRMKQVLEVVQGKCAKRGVPLKNLKTGDLIPGAGTSVRAEITLTQGIPQETAKKIQKAIKEAGVLPPCCSLPPVPAPRSVPSHPTSSFPTFGSHCPPADRG